MATSENSEENQKKQNLSKKNQIRLRKFSSNLTLLKTSKKTYRRLKLKNNKHFLEIDNYESYVNQLPFELRVFAISVKNGCFSPTNDYQEFIVKSMHLEKETWGEPRPHIHHIIPKFEFGLYFKNKNGDREKLLELMDNKFNLILIEKAEHIKAHEIRFATYKVQYDRFSVALLRNFKEEIQKLVSQAGGRALAKINKELGRGFFSSVLQKELSHRALKNPNIRQIRSEAGKKGNKEGKAQGGRNALTTEQRKAIGKESGRNRVNAANIFVKAEDKLLLFYEGEPFVCITGFFTGGQICEFLNELPYPPANFRKLKRLTVSLKDAVSRRDGYMFNNQKSRTKKRRATKGWSIDFINENKID